MLCTILAGCGGGSGGTDEATSAEQASAPKTVSGSAVKGPFQASQINAYQYDNSGNPVSGVPIASATTDNNGNFLLNLQAGVPNALLGVSGGGFYDESDPAGQRFIVWPEDEQLLGFLPAGQSTAAITPVADGLVKKSRRDAANGLPFLHSILENRRLASLAYGFDPVSIIPPDPTNPPANASEDALQYAMTLGGIAQAINSASLRLGRTTPDYVLLRAMLRDMEDCLLDGRFFGEVIEVNGQPLPADLDINQEIERFRNNNFDKLGTAPLVRINQALCANVLPIAVADAASTDEDVPVSIPVIANDRDPDGSLNGASIQVIQPPAHGSTLIDAASGEIRYVPALNYFGSDRFSYRVEDNLGARTNTVDVVLDIRSVNDAPVANNDVRAILEDSGPQIINVLGNDIDVDGNVVAATLQILSGPTNGTAQIDGSFQVVYTPNPDFSGTDTLTYRVQDDLGAFSNIAVLTISVGAQNDAPVISQIADQSVAEDTTLGPVAFSIADVDQSAASLAVTAVSSNQAVLANSGVQFGGSGSNRHLTIQPNPDAFGQTQVSVTVTDSTNLTATATFNLTVTPVNDPPTARDDQFTVSEDSPTVSLDVLGNDSAAPDSGESLTVTQVGVPNQGGTVTINSGNQLDYTPAADFNGTETFTYSINDGTPGSDASATVSVTVEGGNDPPTAQPDSRNVKEGETLNAASVLGNDTDPEGDLLTAELVTAPMYASSFTLQPDGQFEYVHNGMESTEDSFTYRANDGQATSTTVTVTITIDPVNDAPVAHPDSMTLLEGDSAYGLDGESSSVLSNDEDPENDLLNAILVSGPSHADESGFMLYPDGSFHYQHDGSESTSDSFTYKANDGNLDSNTVTVTINIIPVNDPPVANPDDMQVAEGGTQTQLVGNIGSVLANDSDPENHTLNAVLVSAPAHAAQGGFSLNANGTFSYTHDGSETRRDSFSYKANDSQLDSGVTTVSIIITASNDAPTANPDDYNISFGGTLTTTAGADDVLLNDTDPDAGDSLTAIPVSGPAHASGFTLAADGSFTYTHDGSDVVVDSFTYKANDGTADSNVTTVTINIASASIELGALNGSDGYIFPGVTAECRMGSAVRGADDVNRDGFMDILLGSNASFGNTGKTGEAYLIYGDSHLPALDTLDGAQDGTIHVEQLNDAGSPGNHGYILQGISNGNDLGDDVGPVGDINGDGIPDFLASAGSARHPTSAQFGGQGQSYLLSGDSADLMTLDNAFGSPDGILPVSALSGGTGELGTVLGGVNPGDEAGDHATGAGDVNGDGYGDIVIGAPFADPNGSNSGQAYLVFGGPVLIEQLDGGGSTGDGSANLADLDGTTGYTFNGSAAFVDLGDDASSAGDVNGDGLDDFLLGQRGGGTSFLIFGGSLSALDADKDAVIDPNAVNGTTGYSFTRSTSVAQAEGAGDVNGDGYGDIIFGGDATNTLFIAFGGPALAALDAADGSTNGKINLNNIDASTGMKFVGGPDNDNLGWSVAGAGDVNGDGYDDVIGGDFFADPDGKTNAGMAIVLFGGMHLTAVDAGDGTTDGLAQFANLGIHGIVMNGAVADDRAGDAVGGAGDVNGDGFDDVLVGALNAPRPSVRTGESYLVFGGSALSDKPVQGGSGSDSLAGTSGPDVLIGGQGNDSLDGGPDSDVLIGAEGDDLLLFDPADRRIDGGTGDDTLSLNGNNLNLDDYNVSQGGRYRRIRNIEYIDLNSSLHVNKRDLLRITDTRNRLFVRGSNSDVVTSDEPWFYFGVEVVGGVSYERFEQGAATLFVEVGVDTSGIPDPNDF